MKKSIGERMKNNYEIPYLLRFPMRIPLIIRLDGKNFHRFTSKMDKPFDKKFVQNMAMLSKFLVEELQGAEFAYCQSDEISILIHNYKKLESQPLFNNELQKIVSVSAGLASAYFSYLYKEIVVFDSRAFILPEAEVVNYFIWRQLDAIRNSISMLANSLYSHKELHGKNSKQKQDMCLIKGKNWNNLPTRYKRGIAVKNGTIDFEVPIFTKNRHYIEEILKIEE